MPMGLTPPRRLHTLMSLEGFVTCRIATAMRFAATLAVACSPLDGDIDEGCVQE